MASSRPVWLASVVCGALTLALLLHFFLPPAEPPENSPPPVRDSAELQRRIAILEDSHSTLHSALQDVRATLLRLENRLSDAVPPIAEPEANANEEADEDNEDEEAALLPLPWKGKTWRRSPHNLTPDQVLSQLGVEMEQVDEEILGKTRQVLEEYKAHRREIRQRIEIATDAAMADLNAKSQYFTKEEAEKHIEARKKGGEEGDHVTKIHNFDGEFRRFIIWESEYPQVIEGYRDLRGLRNELRYRLYEELVGPIPERVDDSSE